MPSIQKRKVFSALEVAKMCGVVNQTVINWIRANHLKSSVTPGGQFRVYPDDLREFLLAKNMRIPEELKLLLDEEITTLVIVEDDQILNDVLKAQFARAFPSVEIEQAFDGFQAGSLLAALKPQVVILDLNLPGIDGHELCRRIKTDKSFRSPLVLAVTANDDPRLEAQTLQEGADAFFRKPLDNEKLIQVIRTKLKW